MKSIRPSATLVESKSESTVSEMMSTTTEIGTSFRNVVYRLFNPAYLSSYIIIFRYEEVRREVERERTQWGAAIHAAREDLERQKAMYLKINLAKISNKKLGTYPSKAKKSICTRIRNVSMRSWESPRTNWTRPSTRDLTSRDASRISRLNSTSCTGKIREVGNWYSGS